MTRTDWIQRFAYALLELGARQAPLSIYEFGETAWSNHHHKDPKVAAVDLFAHFQSRGDIMTKAQWVDSFTMRLSELGVRADPFLLSDMAQELWPTMGHLDPSEVAQAEYDEWPPHDH